MSPVTQGYSIYLTNKFMTGDRKNLFLEKMQWLGVSIAHVVKKKLQILSFYL